MHRIKWEDVVEKRPALINADKLAWFSEKSVYLTAFFLPISMPVMAVCLFLGWGCWLVGAYRRKDLSLHRTNLDKWVWAFAFLAGISVIQSSNLTYSILNYLILFAHYLGFYHLVVQHIRTTADLKRLVWTILAAAVIVVGYGFVQAIMATDTQGHAWVDPSQFADIKFRVYSTLENPNLLAGFLVMMDAFFLGFAYKIKDRRTRMWLLGLFVVFSACLGLTYSRGAWISLLAVMVAGSLAYGRNTWWIVILVPLALFFFSDSFADRIMSIIHPVDTSASLRLALWESTMAMIRDYPLTGIGWGAYLWTYPTYDFFIQNPDVKIFHAHNMYLHMMAEVGIPAFLLFLAIIGKTVYMAVRVAKRSADKWLAGMAMGIIASMLSLLVNGVTDHILFNIQLSMFFWMMVAAAYRAYSIMTEENKI
jgi:putative inorganic carbon (HCO3(-)) transporter